MKQIITAALAIVFFSACDNNKSDADYTPTPSVVVGDSQTQKQKDGLQQLVGPTTAGQQPIAANGAQPQTTTAVPVAAGATPAGLNPPHGQPGHRCDIPDGAPLNSAPAVATAQPVAQPTAQPITVKQNAPTIVPATPNQPVAKGMNPAHGQPGHRCDIAVGAPLNSKPTVQPTAQPAPGKAVTVTPQQVMSQQPAAITPVAPGMNPQHGQPGHRCDIAVGAPLNSAPAKKDSAK